MTVEVYLKDMGYLLEGPHWDDISNKLFYVDIFGNAVHRYDPASQKDEKIDIGESVGAMVPTRSGKTMVAAKHKIGYVDWRTGAFQNVTEVEQDKPSTRFNDGKCDPAGRLWAGTMGAEEVLAGVERGMGSLYCMHSNMKVTKHVDNVDISNGMAWTADRKTMYYIDTLRHGVDAFDYNHETGDIGNRRQVVSVPESEGLPDGMCIDSEDMLWVALFNGDVINRYNPKTGEKLQTIRFPTTNITSCCWGGANCDELFVTSAKHFLTEEQKKTQTLAGSVFRVTGLGVKGVKCDPFNDS
ncbi:regucalcin-like [Diadema antillarum]|uniref:regucalcin-like n=1 Tax=Diadema antillarum TaxID=105358 RepID=UPI003A894CDF